jgi:primosomal protein N' (replication factor Y)
VQSLGLIIIDEEQEDTYKSENPPRYHARTWPIPLCRGKLPAAWAPPPGHREPLCRGPGQIRLFYLPDRYNALALPRVRIVDMKAELRAGNGGSISAPLREGSRKTSAGRTDLLFLNRRGANKIVTCEVCGFNLFLPQLLRQPHLPQRQPAAHVPPLRLLRPGGRALSGLRGMLHFMGTGTQKVVEELGELFPGTEVLRMDRTAWPRRAAMRCS